MAGKPQTEMGQKLLAALEHMEGPGRYGPYTVAGARAVVTAALPNIEASAVAARNAELAEPLRKLRDEVRRTGDGDATRWRMLGMLDDLLRLIEDPAPSEGADWREGAISGGGTGEIRPHPGFRGGAG